MTDMTKVTAPKIERNVPRRNPYEIYPWSTLEVGDSLWFKNRTAESIKCLRRRTDRRLGIKTISRKMSGGVRVWRIE